jgi:membrane-associated phospholipid phosphatase
VTKSLFFAFLLALRALAATAQTRSPVEADQQPSQTQADQTPSQVQPPQTETPHSVPPVRPGEKAIKEKDLYAKTGYWHPFTRIPRFLLHDQKAIWTSAFHASERDIKLWAIFGTSTAAVVATDRYTKRYVPNNHSTLVRVATNASTLGHTSTLIPIAAGFYFIGTTKSSERFRETGLLSFEALADAGLVQLVVKSATDRARPQDSNHKGRFWDASDSPPASGFPSGHAIATFAMASVVAHEYHSIWVKIAVYGYAGGVMAARVAADQHFPGDVVAGGLMGWFIGDYVYGKRHNREVDHKPSVTQRILDHVHFGLGF